MLCCLFCPSTIETTCLKLLEMLALLLPQSHVFTVFSAPRMSNVSPVLLSINVFALLSHRAGGVPRVLQRALMVQNVTLAETIVCVYVSS